MRAFDLIKVPEFSQENGSRQIELAYVYPELTAFLLLSTSSYIKYEIRKKDTEEASPRVFGERKKWQGTHLHSLLFLALGFTDA